MTTTLTTQYAEHSGKVSDKWGIYLDVYQRIFQPFEKEPVRLLEIGVQNGGSLEIWARHFENGRRFIGCDIDPKCAALQFRDPRISVVVGDANTDEAELAIARVCEQFDIVIDDGSHLSSDIVKSFARYFPRLIDGGVFLAEDLHCSYWREFEGGLFNPLSSIAFFKWLADVINHEHWGVPGARQQVLRTFFDRYDCSIEEDVLATIHSVEFFNSICVVRKESAAKNGLGERIFAGASDIVSAERPSGQSHMFTPLQTENPWSQFTALGEEQSQAALYKREIARLSEELAERIHELAQKTDQAVGLNLEIDGLRLEVVTLRSEIVGLRSEIAAEVSERSAMQASWSWRLTAPLRAIRRRF